MYMTTMTRVRTITDPRSNVLTHAYDGVRVAVEAVLP